MNILCWLFQLLHACDLVVVGLMYDLFLSKSF